MFKRIDGDGKEEITGFSWADKEGNMENLRMEHIEGCPHTITLQNSAEEETTFYKDDIPKLILALQAAYDFKGN